MFENEHGLYYMGVHSDDAGGYEQDCRSSDFCADVDYYHIQITFSRLMNETEKSYLMEYDGESIWIPKKICRYVNFDKCTMKVHRGVFTEIVNKKYLEVVEGSPVLKLK